MKWVKKGVIFAPDGSLLWSQSHAQVPVADYHPEQNIIRLYYSTRNKGNKSVTSFIDVDADDPQKILYVNPQPILDLGPIGTFDDSGVMPSWIVQVDNKKYLYYIGWNVRNTVPYYNAVGLAISYDNGQTFKKFSAGPLWDRNYKEPFFSASPCVLKSGDEWKIWYLSCTEYKIINGTIEPRYHIKYAKSKNGIDWERMGVIAIDYKTEDEAGIASPSVIKDNDLYRMWYSYRKFHNYRTNTENSYKIGYAISYDGLIWDRRDSEVGINVSESGWDSQMICYPNVIDIKERRFMFYNGNAFGKTGFGYAELIR